MSFPQLKKKMTIGDLNQLYRNRDSVISSACLVPFF